MSESINNTSTSQKASSLDPVNKSSQMYYQANRKSTIIDQILSSPKKGVLKKKRNVDSSQFKLSDSTSYLSMGTPDQLMAEVYDQANQHGIQLSSTEQKLLKSYNKCLFALIKIMTKRMG